MRETMEKAKERRRVGLLFDERMYKHRQAQGKHIENPKRIRAIWENLNAVALLQRCVVLNGKEANDDHLALVHSKEHIDLIKTISSKTLKSMRRSGSKYDSIYFNKGSSEASYLAAGFVIEATEKVAKGELDSAFAIVRPPGHHAEESEPMGFCLFNNVAIATSVILNERPEMGIKKILIVDWDVHHGNSTQKMFYKDPRVLVFSVHRYDSGRFYPEGDDGSYKMTGEGLGAGYNINVPWEGGGVGDADYFAVWDHILLPVTRVFDPDLIIISAGFDAASGDPVGGCCVSPYGYSIMLYKLMRFARGKIVMALEGGYDPISLANSTQACIEMLLDYKPAVKSLEDLPLKPTWSLIKRVRQALCIFWPILAVRIPNKVINSRLLIKVDVDIRQDEVCDRTPTELEHASFSGREDYFEGSLPTRPAGDAPQREGASGLGSSFRPAEGRESQSPSMEILEQAAPAERGSEDITYLGWDASRFAEYDPRSYPGRSDMVRQFVCSKIPTSIREIPGEHVRQATESVARSWTTTLDKVVSEQNVMDNARLAVTQLSSTAITLQRTITQLDEEAKMIRQLNNTIRLLEREKKKALKAKTTAEANTSRAVKQAKAALDAEKKALERFEELSRTTRSEALELKNARLAIAQLEREKSCAQQNAQRLSDELNAKNAEVTRLVAERSEQVDDATNFGYVCAYADCLRTIKDAEGQDIFEQVKDEFMEFLRNNPPENDSTLFIGDLPEWGLDFSFLDPSIKIVNPFGTNAQTPGEEMATLNKGQKVDEMIPANDQVAPTAMEVEQV